MIKVNSRKTIDRIASRFMKANRDRNVIVILAIIMTTVMFTSLFTAASSVVKSQQQQEMRQTMDSSHITVQDMTKEQFDEVKKDEHIDRFGYTIFMTVAENRELVNSQTEVRYADEQGAESYMCQPTEGRMPETYDEIAMSTITMDLLGIPRQLGSKVTLDLTLSGEKKSHDFVLSGYWKGDPLFMAQEVWVSKAFCDANVKTATEESLYQGDYEGGYNISIWCSNLFKLDSYVDSMENRYHIRETAARMSANPAINLFEEDAFPFGTAAALLLIIFLSGYLIIYNVFNISVANDIRAYGLLKNIGTTGRQLKKIVRQQAFTLSVMGIPLGLVIGYFIGGGMTPYLLSDGSGNQIETVVVAHPLIFVVSALFTLLTIYIGCMRPCHIVAKISPVEAVRLTGDVLDGGRKNRKQTGSVTPNKMAAANIKRTWRKAVLVVISLALPIVVLNSTYSIAKGFHFDNFLAAYCTFDFDVSGLTSNRGSSNLRAISPKMAEDLRNHPDTESVALIYDSESMHHLGDAGYENLANILKQSEETEYLKGHQLEKEKQLLIDGEVISHVLGINEAGMEKLKIVEGKIDREKFYSGNYILVEGLKQGFGQYYDLGDIITLDFENGRSKEYTVLAIVEIPYDMGFRFGTGTYFDYTFVLPETEYIAMEGNENAMFAGVDVKEGSDDAFDEWISDYIEKSETSLYVDSKLSVMEECKGFVQKYYVILGILCAVLFVIGLLNFFNTSAVNIMTRRKELTLLEAVGMTKHQNRRMLITESLIYLAAAVILADTIGTLIADPLIQRTVGQAFFFSSEMTIWPSIIILPAMIFISIAVPIYNFKKMQRETVVERLRNE